MFMNIEIERIRLHMSKATLARKLAITPAELDEWIARKRAIPAEKLRALSQVFNGCSVDYLLKT
ncbi:MAG: helix-turn-helix domain-containing protein [Defluviitaleaceae bacterium]|nr:helix-turn-helix domain-containing protein [Defluviitaleaceae bacterium]